MSRLNAQTAKMKVIRRLIQSVTFLLIITAGIIWKGETAAAYEYSCNASLEGIEMKVRDEPAADINSVKESDTFYTGDHIYCNFSCSETGKIKSILWELYTEDGTLISSERDTSAVTYSSWRKLFSTSFLNMKAGKYYFKVTPTDVDGTVQEAIGCYFTLEDKTAASTSYTYSCNASLESIAMKMGNEQAADINSVKESDTFHVGDFIYCNFSCSETGQIKSLLWELYKEDDTLVTSETDSASGSTYSSWYQHFSTLLLELKAGEYYFKVTPTDVSGEALEPIGCYFTLCDKVPSIYTQPEAQTVSEGSTATFSVGVNGDNLQYQWGYSNTGNTNDWKAISGATQKSYTTPAVDSSYNGRYYFCLISNYGNEVFSSGAKLTVGETTSGEPTQKSNQTISGVSSRTVVYSPDSFFKLNAKAKGALSYTSSNTNVAIMDVGGTVWIEGYGKTTITIRAAATSEYNAASKKITVTVVPAKVTIKKAASPSKGKLSFRWNYPYKQPSITGYQVCFYDKKGTKTNKNLTKTTLSVSGKSGKKFYLKVRAYKTVGGKKYFGAWSKEKGVKVK